MARIAPATEENLRRAADLLRAGELVSFPTETVYGLGGDASNPEAVGKIFAAKGRPADHPLIVHLAGATDLPRWAATVPEEAILLAEKFWPGPLTLVLQRGPEVPPQVTGEQPTVALRVPGHPLAHRLLELFGGGVAAPSANRFGRLSPTTAQHVAAELDERVALILDGGPAEVGVESTIVDLSGAEPRILRPGGVSREQLAALLGSRLAAGPATSGSPRVPGALESHYAPSSGLQLLSPDLLDSRLGSTPVSVLSPRPAPLDFQGRWSRLPADPRGYARGLYAALRELDELGLPILVEEPPPGAEWEAVHDRLRRASAGKGVVAGEESG